MNTRNTSANAISRLSAWACLGWALASTVSPTSGADEGFVWQPRDKTVTVTRVESTGPDGKSTAGTRIRGRMERGWNLR